VVAAAAEVADEVGFDGLTLASVADRFGVAVPSLYKHVDGLDGLRRGVAVLSIRELGRALAPAATLGEMAVAYRGFAHAHPGRYAATIRAVDPGDEEGTVASDEVLATALRVMSGYDLAGADAIDATRALRAALHGFVTLEAAGGFGIPQDVDRSFDRMVGAFDRALRTWRPTAAVR
jgi:AcrR family transcriptional regulator